MVWLYNVQCRKNSSITLWGVSETVLPKAVSMGIGNMLARGGGGALAWEQRRRRHGYRTGCLFSTYDKILLSVSPNMNKYFPPNTQQASRIRRKKFSLFTTADDFKGTVFRKILWFMMKEFQILFFLFIFYKICALWIRRIHWKTKIAWNVAPLG